MKRKISIIIIITLIINVSINLLGNISLGATKNKEESEKKNHESYWSTTNAPLFYGTTKITLKKGIIDEFDVLDSRFRIFAKDFEDGDLTPQITYSGEVKPKEVGEYEIRYQVTDSHNNETTLIVPVIVTDDENAKITVERTIYTTPSVWNMDLAEFSRCNYGDRQILGIFLTANQSIKARIISAEKNLKIAFINNDEYNETAKTIPTTGEWITLENIKEDVGYDSVPLLSTTVLSRENTTINKTYKIELEYDETIKPLNYYHYLDNEEEFRNNWIKSGDSFGVIESETLTLVVPSTDIEYMTNYYRNGFTSLDKFLEYYQKVVEKMDEYIGLDFNPEKITDQNVRTKYLIRANVHGIGAAYYAGDHVGVNNASMKSFFEMNWGGLHELAHGYQGSLGKGEMLLGEVANNILGHYIQIDKSIYFHQGNWLGSLSSIEENRNEQRLAGKTFLQVDEPTRLYVIINLLDHFESGTTYGKMFSWYREELNKGRIMTNQDAYVEAIADIYNINIIPYMEAWGLNISETTKEKVYEENYPLINILKDMLKDDTLTEIMNGEGIDRKYTPISNEIIQKYNIKSDITLNIDIDNISKIEGKIILVKQGKDIIKKVKINNEKIELNDIPVGTYFLQMPIINGYSQEHIYIKVKEDGNNIYTYTYQKSENEKFDNYLMIRLLGYNYDTIAYQLTFKDDYTKAEIRYPNQSAMSGNEYVKIFDNSGRIVTEDLSTGGYFDFNKGPHEIELEPGYTIEIKYPNKYASKIVVYNTLTNVIIPEYKAIDTVTRYTVIENGIMREDMTKEDADNIAYDQLKAHLIRIIENYKQKVTETELGNKMINYKEKSFIINTYNQLKEEDKMPYTELIEAIKRGGMPKITSIAEKFEYELGTNIDLYSLISATDNEDGPIVIDKNSTVIKTNLKTNEPGIYAVTYEVSDSDNNTTIKTIQIEIIGDSEVPGEGEGEEDKEEETPPEPDDGDKEEETPSEPDEEDKEEETPQEPDEEDKEETPPEIDNEDKDEEAIPPNINDENKEEIITTPSDEEKGDIETPEKNEETIKLSDKNENIESQINKLSSNQDDNNELISNLDNSQPQYISQDNNVEENTTNFSENSELKDETISQEDLPETGENYIIIKILIGLAIFSIIITFIIKKRMKN